MRAYSAGAPAASNKAVPRRAIVAWGIRRGIPYRTCQVRTVGWDKLRDTRAAGRGKRRPTIIAAMVGLRSLRDLVPPYISLRRRLGRSELELLDQLDDGLGIGVDVTGDGG